MKKIISLLLITILILSFAATAFAVKSPTIEEMFVPKTTFNTGFYRVCNSEGQTVKYLSSKDVTCESLDNLMDYSTIPGLIYAFNFSSTYELQDREYIEFPINLFVTKGFNLNAIMDKTETELVIERILDDYWMLHVSEYGVILITIVEE